MLFGFNCLIDLDNMVVPQLQQQIDLLHKLLFLNRVCEALLVERLEGNQLSHKFVHGKVDFAKSSSTKHLADSVKVNLGLRSFAFLGK